MVDFWRDSERPSTFVESFPDTTPPRYVLLSGGEDWRFVWQDVRDANDQPLSLTSRTLSLAFFPQDLAYFTIANLALVTDTAISGISVLPGDTGMGPTITVLSLAKDRTWFPAQDSTILGDLMLRGQSNNVPIQRLRRLSFVAQGGYHAYPG